MRPYNATAGLGEAVTVKANLEGAPKVRDSVVLQTNVIQVYDLDATVPQIISNYTLENLSNWTLRSRTQAMDLTDSTLL